MLGKVETVDLVLGRSQLGHGEYGCVDSAATRALVKLDTVKHFAVDGPTTNLPSHLLLTRSSTSGSHKSHPPFVELPLIVLITIDQADLGLASTRVAEAA